MTELLAGPWGPVLIFGMRLVDVSLRTLRVKLIASGARWTASLLGFFGILVWLLAAGGAMQNLSSPLHVVAYAGGFAAGTALGMQLEAMLALGVSKVQAVSPQQGEEVADGLREQGLGATAVEGEGREGAVTIVSTVVPRKRIPHAVQTIERHDPDAFITVHDDTRTRRGWYSPVEPLR